jgi:hypothetical protein
MRVTGSPVSQTTAKRILTPPALSHQSRHAFNPATSPVISTSHPVTALR